MFRAGNERVSTSWKGTNAHRGARSRDACRNGTVVPIRPWGSGPDGAAAIWGLEPLPGCCVPIPMNTSTHTSNPGELPGLHGRLTVLPAEPRDRATMTEQLARLLLRAQDDAPTELSV